MMLRTDPYPICIHPGKRVRIIVGNATMHKLIRNLLLVGVAAATAFPAVGQDQEPADTADGEKVGDMVRSCITLRSLRRTQVIDDRNVLFRMRGRTVYHNILPQRCGGLAREDRFSYDAQFGRLCQGDLIRVLYSDSFGTYGLREGPGCRIGKFHKITQEDAKALLEGPSTQATPPALPMPPPQEVGSDSADTEERVPE